MIIILRNEEDWARFQRRLVHDLPDNQVEDELARLKFLETGKMIVSDIQFTRMACRAAAKMSAEEKRKCRESLRWSIYDRKLQPTIN